MPSRIFSLALAFVLTPGSVLAQSATAGSPAPISPPATTLGRAAATVGNVVVKDFAPVGQTAMRWTTTPIVFEAATISRPDNSGAVRGLRVTVSDGRLSRSGLVDLGEMNALLKAIDFMIAKSTAWRDTDLGSYREVSFTSLDDVKIGFYQEGKKQTAFATIGVIGAVTSTFNMADMPKVRAMTEQAVDMLTHPDSPPAAAGAVQ